MRALALLRRVYVASRVRDLLPHSLKLAFRGLWLAVARRIDYPISSPRLPRPRAIRTGARLRLGRVLLACDLNSDYLDFWPSTRRAWNEIVGLDATLVLVAAADRLPADLRADPAVIPFEPIEGVHTAFQAQCVRLLYPAVLPSDGAVIISDIDLYPLRADYFHDPVRPLDERSFVVYRDERLDRGEVDMMFNAALPATWSEVFEVATVEDVRRELTRWATGLTYDGRRGWEGWYTDQRTLHRTLFSWRSRSARLWVLDDQYCRHRRLHREELVREAGLEEWRVEGLRRRAYSDFNCLVPYREHRVINDEVLALGLEAARR